MQYQPLIYIDKRKRWKKQIQISTEKHHKKNKWQRWWLTNTIASIKLTPDSSKTKPKKETIICLEFFLFLGIPRKIHDRHYVIPTTMTLTICTAWKIQKQNKKKPKPIFHHSWNYIKKLAKNGIKIKDKKPETTRGGHLNDLIMNKN